MGTNKLSDSAVLDMRSCASETRSQEELNRLIADWCEEYHIGKGTIRNLLHGKTYRHLIPSNVKEPFTSFFNDPY